MVGMAVVVAVPLGIGTAVYMTEVKGPGSHLIRTVVEAMTALSDILAGLFVYATWSSVSGWARPDWPRRSPSQ